MRSKFHTIVTWCHHQEIRTDRVGKGSCSCYTATFHTLTRHLSGVEPGDRRAQQVHGHGRSPMSTTVLFLQDVASPP